MVSVLSTLYKLYMISEKFYGVKLYSLEKSMNKIPFSLPNFFSLSFTIYKTLKHKKKLQKIEKKMEKKNSKRITRAGPTCRAAVSALGTLRCALGTIRLQQ